jgi:hypothetical protein
VVAGGGVGAGGCLGVVEVTHLRVEAMDGLVVSVALGLPPKGYGPFERVLSRRMT